MDSPLSSPKVTDLRSSYSNSSERKIRPIPLKVIVQIQSVQNGQRSPLAISRNDQLFCLTLVDTWVFSLQNIQDGDKDTPCADRMSYREALVHHDMFGVLLREEIRVQKDLPELQVDQNGGKLLERCSLRDQRIEHAGYRTQARVRVTIWTSTIASEPSSGSKKTLQRGCLPSSPPWATKKLFESLSWSHKAVSIVVKLRHR